jgi:preprotein translocase subunit SecY
MASAAEQLASNLNFGAFSKATELKKRLWFTLGALIVYRLGTYIPLPGIAGGALGRMTIFALNIMPYISASIIMQLMTSLSPSVAQLKKEGETGRKKINQYTRYGTVLIALFQSYGIAVGLESMTGTQGTAVMDPGAFFRFTTVVTLVGGTIFLIWLGEQITARGVGNGISLIIFAGIVAELPSALAATLELGRTGALSTLFIAALLIGAIVVIYGIVFVERSQRKLIVQYPKRQVGNKMFGGENSHLPLKINTSGVIPLIFASSILLMPITLINFTASSGPGFLTTVAAFLGRGQPAYLLMYGSLIAFFAFFYTSVVFSPTDTADNLKKYGGFIPGIRPGKNTADYLNYVLTRLTVVGAAYLVLIAILPELLIARFSVPFFFGGTSLLIVVSVTLDTVAQVQSHLLAHQYEGLVKKSRLRGRR